MTRDGLLPPKQLAAVVARLYADADALGWTGLIPQERSLQYARWIDDAAVGKVLQTYMTPEQARSWIKDGPMKEYANARRGQGRYARFGRQGGTGPADIAEKALGAGAAVVPGSEGVKPPHCLATDVGEKTAYLVWGEAANLRNLLWAALRAAVTDNMPAHIVILEPPGRPTPTAEARTHQAIVRRCRLTLHYLTEVLGQAPAPGTQDQRSVDTPAESQS